MRAEFVTNLPKTEVKPYLRVATIASKTALSYFYVGKNENSIRFLSETFAGGFTAENLDRAKKILKSELSQRIDAVILDLNYDEKELRGLHAVLKTRGFHTAPIIYNNQHDGQVPKNDDLIDDVIDLNNWQFDLATKISFLKKAKEHHFTRGVENYDITPSKSIVKRMIDLAIASFLLLLLLPVFLIIALLIKLESKGPVIYNAQRAGRGFRIFNFYKFRTMVVNADKKIQELAHLNQYTDSANGAQFFKIANDPRITKIGRFLRNTSLDELPQLFNVLKGDMSLVGNRPLPLYEAATLTTNEFVERFMAPAGITGLWQIKKRGKSDMSIEERLNLDISYVRKSNLLYDFWIMINTPKALIQKNDV